MTLRITEDTLSSITSQGHGVEVPTYDRSQVTAGIVHFGVGGFHRAHQAMALDSLMRDGQALDWGICGVGVMPADARMRDALADQDGMYSMVVKHADGHRDVRIIGSIVEYLFAPEDPEAVIARMCDPAIRIVSLTVTEGGYNFDPATGEFDVDNAAIQADLVPEAVPQTTFGLITEALVRRREQGIPPFTVMSCDNIQANGDIAARTFGVFASLRDPELGEWLKTNVAFPNSMVDRITPVTTPTDIEELVRDFGVQDSWPVVCEPFFQWVLEDNFPTGRPPLENAGVQVVNDVEPYELMKLRLLNVGHQAIAYTGYLAGFRYAHEAASDPAIAAFTRAYMDLEGTPTLHPVPGVDLDEYKTTLIERFANPEVRDTLARLCADSSDRIPTWLVPVIKERLAAGADVTLSAAIVASWVRYALGTDEEGAPIEVVDRLREELAPLAAKQSSEPLAFVSVPALFGDIAHDPRFTRPYLAALSSFHEVGSHATVASLVAG